MLIAKKPGIFFLVTFGNPLNRVVNILNSGCIQKSGYRSDTDIEP